MSCHGIRLDTMLRHTAVSHTTSCHITSHGEANQVMTEHDKQYTVPHMVSTHDSLWFIVDAAPISEMSCMLQTDISETSDCAPTPDAEASAANRRAVSMMASRGFALRRVLFLQMLCRAGQPTWQQNPHRGNRLKSWISTAFRVNF